MNTAPTSLRQQKQAAQILRICLAPLFVLALAGLVGCGLMQEQSAPSPGAERTASTREWDDAIGVPYSRRGVAPPTRTNDEKAEFYWHYAALASSIYGTEGFADASLLRTVTSPYLRKEVLSTRDPKIEAEFERVLDMDDAQTFDWLRRRCDGRETVGHAVDWCNVYHHYRKKLGDLLPEDVITMTDAVPRKGSLAVETPSVEARPADPYDDCNAKHAKVPLSVVMHEMKWERVKELDKYTLGRGWRVFVPDLAIDVWRRQRPEFAGENAVEYAIVFRGTVGTGGWVSNFRILTGLVPVIFWDQYLQAHSATLKIVEQIYMLHSVRDSLMPSAPRSRILITTVGHSLGAGLASYVHYKIPAITRVVGFNPTPIDGSRSLVSTQEREAFLNERGDKLDVYPPLRSAGQGFERTSVYLVYEKGEILSRLDTCDSGPLWGSEGGPTVLCERVNLSSGSLLSQHSMPQLACKMALQAGVDKRDQHDQEHRSASAPGSVGSLPR